MRRSLALVALVVLVGGAGCLGAVGMDDDDDGATGATPGATDLAFSNVADETGLEYASEEGGIGNGNDGVYVADYDRDLREDVLVLGNDSAGPALFHNTGDGFERTGELPTLDGRVQSALWFDHDNDGWEDLLLLRRDGTPVFLENDGGSLQRTEVGLEDEQFVNPLGASAADADGDGRLELFVFQYGRWDESAPKAFNRPIFEDEADNGEPNAYFDWDGESYVRDDDAGVTTGERGPHWSMATSFRDLTGDGHPDLHVANDYFNDTLYVNQGDGTFDHRYLGGSTDRNGMSSTTADVTGDGEPEIFVTNIFFPIDRRSELPEAQQKRFAQDMQSNIGKRMHGNNLLTYRDGEFVDVGPEFGVSEGGWGWGATFADLDSDGERDLFQATQDQVRFDPDEPKYSTPMVWLKHGDEFHAQTAPSIGLELHDGRGVASLDYQLDGARDVAVGTYAQPYRLYRNDASQGESLQVVVGPGDAGHTAVGAEVTAVADGRAQYRTSSSRADYQGQDTRVLHLGLGDAETVEELRVSWPDGTERTFEDVDAGQRIRVTPDGIEDRVEYESP